jgi:short-subunit dehydrogenase
MGTALITGASAGLGTEFAKLFAADKHDLILVARRKDRLDALGAELSKAHGIKVHSIAADLMDPNAWSAVVAEVEKAGLTVDFLVNNAGFGTTGPFIQLDAAKEIGEVTCNVTTLLALTRAFLPGMVKRGKGRILNLGSTAGFQPGPYMATYYATKAFVNSFTEALWFELKGTGVTATVSCPGATATEFSAVSGNDKSRLFAMGAMTAPEVAAAAYAAMNAGKPMIVHGFKNKLGAIGAQVAPRGIVRSMAAAANLPPGGSAPALKA